jgi:hypothetical protein
LLVSPLFASFVTMDFSQCSMADCADCLLDQQAARPQRPALCKIRQGEPLERSGLDRPRERLQAFERNRDCSRDANSQPLAYVYFEDNDSRRAVMNRLSRDEARRIAANVAKLPMFIEADRSGRPRANERAPAAVLNPTPHCSPQLGQPAQEMQQSKTTRSQP